MSADHLLTVAGGGVPAGAEPAVRREAVLDVGGQRIRMSVAAEGSGRPLLLVNGLGATGDLFDDVRVHLTDRETIAFDAPGVGGSPSPPVFRRIRWYAGVVAEMIELLGHHQVDVLGLSWGGALAQELAIRHPHLVRRMVLAATTPGVISVPGRPEAIAVLMTPLRYYSPAYLEAVAPTLYGGAIRRRPDLLRRHAAVRAGQPPSPLGYAVQMGALRRWTSLPHLSRVLVPTLVMAGDDDPIIPLANGRMIARLLPNARLHVVTGGGHMFLYTRALEMSEHIRAFLDED